MKSEGGGDSQHLQRLARRLRRRGGKPFAAVGLALGVLTSVGSTGRADTLRDGPQLFTQAVVRGDEQRILMSVIPGREKSLVSTRFSFQPRDDRPEDRDVWIDVRVVDKVYRGKKVPSPAFVFCTGSPRPLEGEDFVGLSGRVGLSVLLPIECFSPLVKGARYEVVVHWKTTPPAGMTVPEGLLVSELVSAPITYKHLGLERRRTPEARLERAGLDVSKARTFLEDIRRRALSGDWPGLCTMTSMPLRVNDARLPSGSRDMTILTQAECERVMPRVFDRRYVGALAEDRLLAVENLVEREPGEFSVGPRIRIAGVCAPGQSNCENRAPRIVYVMALGGP